MRKKASGRYDGKVIVLDEPLGLEAGQRVHLDIQTEEGAFIELLSFAADLPDAPTDLAKQHDHYLYGSPRK